MVSTADIPWEQLVGHKMCARPKAGHYMQRGLLYRKIGEHALDQCLHSGQEPSLKFP